MGSLSIWHWLIVLAVVLILFGGGGKLSRLMGDMGKGIKAFKAGLNEHDEAHASTPPRPIENPTVSTVPRRDETVGG